MVRFGEKSYWESRMTRGRHGYGLRKSIMAGKEEFWKFIIFSLGSRENISFWNDLWVGGDTFKGEVPNHLWAHFGGKLL